MNTKFDYAELKRVNLFFKPPIGHKGEGFKPPIGHKGEGFKLPISHKGESFKPPISHKLTKVKKV